MAAACRVLSATPWPPKAPSTSRTWAAGAATSNRASSPSLESPLPIAGAPMKRSKQPFPASSQRRQLLQAGAAGLAVLAAPAIVRAQGAAKVRVGYWPIAAGLPFYAAVEQGFFKAAGIEVEVQRYAGAQQIMEAMLAERCDGSANGTGSANIAIG